MAIRIVFVKVSGLHAAKRGSTCDSGQQHLAAGISAELKNLKIKADTE